MLFYKHILDIRDGRLRHLLQQELLLHLLQMLQELIVICFDPTRYKVAVVARTREFASPLDSVRQADSWLHCRLMSTMPGPTRERHHDVTLIGDLT